jgi:8-oxo-dGTP pyrophosphatase MutT (NUDIX family)
MLSRLRTRLRAADTLRQMDSTLPADAAVLIAITDEPDPHVILTVRASRLKTHAGEVAFPGGKRDESDRDLAHTALRESFEEIGLDPALVEIVGIGAPLRSRFGLQVQPIVGIVPHDVQLAPNDAELESIFRVPLHWLLQRNNLLVEEVMHEGSLKDSPRYVVDGRHVFGLTAMLLVDLLNTAWDFGVEIRR